MRIAEQHSGAAVFLSIFIVSQVKNPGKMRYGAFEA
jgi:hypothetical protein